MGHVNHFPDKSDLEKLRDVIAQKEKELEWQKGAVASWRKTAETNQRKLSATKAVVTKTKQRIAKGKCPKCSHEFVDLGKHMASQHPDYAAA